MAQKKAFYDQPVDRTPYGACAWVALAILAVLVAGVLGVWKVGGMVKHSSFGLAKPNINTQAAGDAVRNAADIQSQSLQQQLQDEITQQKDAATKAAEQAVKDQAQQAVDSQKQQYEKYLQQ